MSRTKDYFLYYFSIFSPIVVTMVVFLLFFENSQSFPTNLLDQVLFYSKFFWFTGVWFVVTNFLGFVYGSPYKTDQKNQELYKSFGWNNRKELVVTYVSRADNVEALGRSISKTEEVLKEMRVRYIIEVVTDISVINKLQRHNRVRFHEVPSEYQTEKNAQYKARALHYVLESREEVKDYSVARWVLHLDEESCLTPSVVAGISAYINNPDNAGSIGQGEIQYNSYNYGNHFINTVTDSVRSGDDLGRFRFQYKTLNKPIFGMHGSFILVPEHIEKILGFDLGGRGSITEDAYFALIASDRGYKFHWVDGHIREQSPFSLMAIIKQRRRWFCGLWLLSFDPLISFKTRLPLMINTILWSLAWIGPVVTFFNLVMSGGYFPLPMAILAALIQGGYASVYLVGAYRNLQQANISIFYKVIIYCFSYLLLPVSSLIEGLAIIYALIAPVKTFDVVKK